MRWITCAILLCVLDASAQDWALINPAYKYNYSDDGTDTISNQVLVVSIDTINLDTTRMAMPLVAKFIEGTSGTWGQCNLEVNLPQFVQKECYHEGGRWRFHDPEDLILHPQAPLNASWLFNTNAIDSGTIVNLAQEIVLGTLDSVRTMVSQAGDTIHWSKNHGILLWHLAGESRFQLIGIRGPNIGQLVPSISNFFPFHPGDVMEFASGGSSNYHSFRYEYRMMIENRTEGPGTVSLSGPTQRVFIPWYGPYLFSSYESSTVTFDSLSSQWLKPVFSWPGQLITFNDVNDGFANGQLHMVVKHLVDDQGHYIITGESVSVGGQSMFDIVDTVQANCLFVASPSGNNYNVSTMPQYGYGWNAMVLGSGYFSVYGGILNGDTVGTVHSEDYFHVGTGEIIRNRVPITFAPNPASDHITLHGLPKCAITVYIRDAIGSLQQTMTLHGPDPGTIDVSHLAPGVYLVNVDVMAAWRLVIAR